MTPLISSKPLFAAPEGHGWVKRTYGGKFHLVRKVGGPYLCASTDAKPLPGEALIQAFYGPKPKWRARLCRWCCRIAGFDPDTGALRTPTEEEGK